MISVERFCTYLHDNDLSFYCGVPDSLLKNLCSYVDQNYADSQHVISVNEGSAVALAIGKFFGTGKPSIVYMQNSGLGNAVNPLVSLASEQVAAVPMLLIIGWRGEPGVADEPQHIHQGQITLSLLDVLNIPYVVIDADCDFENDCADLLQLMHSSNKVVAIVVKKDTFGFYPAAVEQVPSLKDRMSREEALQVIHSSLTKADLVISTTGKTSREVYELQTQNYGQCDAFLTIGGMGHCSAIALGVSMSQPHKRVICIDGDGAMLMHMGSLATNAHLASNNFIHIVLDNHAHESVGGQKTLSASIAVTEIAEAVGYVNVSEVTDFDELSRVMNASRQSAGSTFIVVKIKTGSRSDLGRPQESPQYNKASFMKKMELHK